MSQAGNNIVIRLEVQIPVGGQGAGPPVVLAAPMSVPQVNGVTQISTPTSGPTKVRVDDCGNFICAQGVSLNGSNQPARTVFAKVYQGIVGLGGILALPDGVTRAVAVNRANGTWEFTGDDDSEIPGAQCSACTGSGSGSGSGTGGLPNTLALWIDWGSDPLEKRCVVFQGCCSTQTECDDESFSLPQSRAPATPSARVAPARAPAPRQWSVDVEGFPSSGPSAVFNGSWVLNLREGEGGQISWDNGGDGEEAPAVELHGGGTADWELALRAGATVVRYRRPAGAWNPLGPNTLDLAEGKTGRRKLPHSLTVVPL